MTDLLQPETRKTLLEDMDTKFGGVNHVDKGADLMGVEDSHHAELDHTLDDMSGKTARAREKEIFG